MRGEGRFIYWLLYGPCGLEGAVILVPLWSLQVRERALRSELQDRETELRGIVAEVRQRYGRGGCKNEGPSVRALSRDPKVGPALNHVTPGGNATT